MFWTTQNWGEGAVLTISSVLDKLHLQIPFAVVDDIHDNFYDYSLLKADGKRLLADFATTERDTTNDFGMYVKNIPKKEYIYLKIPVPN